jgi:hypothetical protein
MTEQILTEEEEGQVVSKIQSWLGQDGIDYFQVVKAMHGTLDAYWFEASEIDFIPQYIPRSINAQEGKTLRTFMKTLEECKEWETKDFENQWLPVLEKCIEEEEDEDD